MASIAASHGRKGNRSWFRDLFYDHPPQQNLSHMSGSLAGGKVKVACKRCFDNEFAALKTEDEGAVAAGALSQVRSDDILRSLLFGHPRHIIQSHGKTLINHLISCEFQSEETKVSARKHKLTYGTTKSPQKSMHASFDPGPPSNLFSHYAPSGSAMPYGNDDRPFILLNSPPNPVAPLPHAGPSHIDPGLRYHPYPRMSNTASISAPSLLAPGMYSQSSPPGSIVDSLTPSDSASQISGRRYSRDRSLAPGPSRPSSQLGYNSNRRHSSYNIPPPTGVSPDLRVPHWPDMRKKHFEHRVLRLTASAGFPLSWVENPEWQLFCEEFIPGAPTISRKVLTKRILREVVAEFREAVKQSAKGKEATMQGDGWTGLNNHHLLAFMITADKKVHTVEVHDSTKERKTAENLLAELERVYAELKDKWGVIVVGLVTDASGESRKARRLFATKFPFVIVLDCYAHQVNLVVGDFFKSKSSLLKYSEMATQLIAWLRSKTRILAHLPLSVLRAVLTRWTAHYMPYRRLIQLYPSLRSLVYADMSLPDSAKVLVSGDAAAKRKAREMVQIIEDPTFWHSIALITRYLEPLAIAANIVQDSFCRMDQVLLTFAFLVMRFKDNQMNQDPVSRDAIIQSIETRWSKCDQEVFICAVLVNPFYRTTAFAPLPLFNYSNIKELFKRLYRRFCETEPSHIFVEHAMDFMEGTGYFAALEGSIKDELLSATQHKRQPDPLAVLKGFSHPQRPEDESPFCIFARRILSVSANSASCERLFSMFGNILTKLRSRLGNSVLVDLSEVKMHIRDEHKAGGGKARLRRHFSATGSRNQEPSPPTAPSNSSSGSTSGSVDEIINDILRNNQRHAATTTTPLAPATASGSNSSLESEAAASEFTQIISQQMQLVAEDNTDNAPDRSSPGWTSTQISEIFDFRTTTTWSQRYSHFASLTFEEELALYEFLEMDAPGEDDPDISLDATTQDILIN